MVKRTQKKTSPGKIRKLVEGKESLEANFAELSGLVPDIQTALDSDDIPCLLREKRLTSCPRCLIKLGSFPLF